MMNSDVPRGQEFSVSPLTDFRHRKDSVGRWLMMGQTNYTELRLKDKKRPPGTCTIFRPDTEEAENSPPYGDRGLFTCPISQPMEEFKEYSIQPTGPLISPPLNDFHDPPVQDYQALPVPKVMCAEFFRDLARMSEKYELRSPDQLIMDYKPHWSANLYFLTNSQRTAPWSPKAWEDIIPTREEEARKMKDYCKTKGVTWVGPNFTERTKWELWTQE
jgi:hypothetical protein